MHRADQQTKNGDEVGQFRSQIGAVRPPCAVDGTWQVERSHNANRAALEDWEAICTIGGAPVSYPEQSQTVTEVADTRRTYDS